MRKSSNGNVLLLVEDSMSEPAVSVLIAKASRPKREVNVTTIWGRVRIDKRSKTAAFTQYDTAEKGHFISANDNVALVAANDNFVGAARIAA